MLPGPPKFDELSQVIQQDQASQSPTMSNQQNQVQFSEQRKSIMETTTDPEPFGWKIGLSEQRKMNQDNITFKE